MQEALKLPLGSESESSETEYGTRDDIKVIKHLCTVGIFCNDKIVRIMSPISFSDKFVLLSLKGYQNLISKSRSILGVVVDNTKLIDLFSALYVPCIKSR